MMKDNGDFNGLIKRQKARDFNGLIKRQKAPLPSLQNGQVTKSSKIHSEGVLDEICKR